MHHRSMFTTLLACVALALGAAACAKPKDDDCKNAIANIRHLYGTASMTQGISPQAAVRSCRGSASRESVQCIISAKTIQELESCAGGGEFLETMKDVSATQSQQAPTPQATPTPTPQATPTPAPQATPTPAPQATPTPTPQDPAQAPAQPQQDPAQAQQPPAQPQQPQQNPAQPPAQPQQNPAENPGQPAAPGQQPPSK